MRILLRLSGCCLLAGMTLPQHSSRAGERWRRPALTEPEKVTMSGLWGETLGRGEARIGHGPYSVPYFLADLNFGMQRSFTNFSGDISGRFLELASLNSPANLRSSEELTQVMKAIPGLQQPDGHFGADIAWNEPIDFKVPFNKAKFMPTLWGNGRLLLGLLAAHERFDDPKMLETAQKLGDFYVNVVADRFCDPARVDEYRKSPDYAAAYVTCVYQGVAGLVGLYRATLEDKYLKVAERMADFHEGFDTLPVGHSHGSISVHEALLMLFEQTGDAKYLRRVTARWQREMSGGYVNPAGGVLEKLVVSGCERDEGCAEADWLRLNLMLWRDTGETRYLDAAERLLYTEFPANQWSDGGFGHRALATDAQGAFAFGPRMEEAVWCCNFHCPLVLRELKSYLAVGTPAGVYYNFPTDFKTEVKAGTRTDAGRGLWDVSSKLESPEEGVPVRCKIYIGVSFSDADVGCFVRVPDWADEVAVTLREGQTITGRRGEGYLRVPLSRWDDARDIQIRYRARPYMESRLGVRVPVPDNLPAVVKNVVVRNGPWVLLNNGSRDIGEVKLLVRADGTLALTPEASAMLAPWGKVDSPDGSHAFVFNAVLTAAEQ